MAKVKVLKNVVTSKGDAFEGQTVDLPADEVAFLSAAGKVAEVKGKAADSEK